MEPEQPVVSVAIPGISSGCEPGQGKGGASASCRSMNTYVSREAAESHLGPEADIAILEVETAWQMAHTVWVEPYLNELEPTS